MSTPAPAAVTPEDLLARPDADSYELIDGQLVEKHMGAHAGLVAATLIALLRADARARGLGRVFTSDCSYQIGPGRNLVRKPDVSFIARGRLPGDQLPAGHLRIPPDLAVEVVSPNDLAEDIDARVADYLEAGVRLMWVVYPATR